MAQAAAQESDSDSDTPVLTPIQRALQEWQGAQLQFQGLFGRWDVDTGTLEIPEDADEWEPESVSETMAHVRAIEAEMGRSTGPRVQLFHATCGPRVEWGYSGFRYDRKRWIPTSLSAAGALGAVNVDEEHTILFRLDVHPCVRRLRVSEDPSYANEDEVLLQNRLDWTNEGNVTKEDRHVVNQGGVGASCSACPSPCKT